MLFTLILIFLNPKHCQSDIWSNTSVLMTNIYIIFLAQCWRWETSSRSFYDFIKMTIYQDLAIFNSWHLTFLIVPYSTFQKNETLES